MAESTASPAATQTNPAPKQRCGFIKTGGEQCRSVAMIGQDYCWPHRWYAKPQYTGVKGYDTVHLLEDEAAIQLLISQAMQGVVNGDLSESRGRTLVHGANAATTLLRLRFQRERWLFETKQQPEEPVREATRLDRQPLAPPQPYRGPAGKFEPYWSFSKYMYEQECERLGRPRPTCPEDMPPSGWMDEEEYFEDPDVWTARYREKIKAAHEQAEAAEKENNESHPEERSDEGPCVSFNGQPDPEPTAIDLQAAAVPEPCTLNSARPPEPYTLNPAVIPKERSSQTQNLQPWPNTLNPEPCTLNPALIPKNRRKLKLADSYDPATRGNRRKVWPRRAQYLQIDGRVDPHFFRRRTRKRKHPSGSYNRGCNNSQLPATGWLPPTSYPASCRPSG